MKQRKVLLIGAGSRGYGYATLVKQMSDRYRIVAVADPIEERRLTVGREHDLPAARCVADWRELLAEPKLADVAFICTSDREHEAPALAAIERGYDILLEKPIAPTPEACVRITEAAKARGVQILVCHVLRFTPFYRRLKQLITEGRIGEVQAVTQIERVGMLHQSHSFVRGSYGNSARASTMLLQKSCHDLDILQWLIDKPCLRVQSFGSLRYFTEENAPAGAPERCIDGCPVADTCPFNANVLYRKNTWFSRAATKKRNATEEEIVEALKTTNYGRCVYRCDNDVVDRQTVNMEFADGVVATFAMIPFTSGVGGREIRIMGSEGALSGCSGDAELRYESFKTDTVETLSVFDSPEAAGSLSGHGGGDAGALLAFSRLLDGEEGTGAASVEQTCQNHMIVFAAERSRATYQVVNLVDFSREYRFAYPNPEQE